MTKEFCASLRDTPEGIAHRTQHAPTTKSRATNQVRLDTRCPTRMIGRSKALCERPARERCPVCLHIKLSIMQNSSRKTASAKAGKHPALKSYLERFVGSRHSPPQALKAGNMGIDHRISIGVVPFRGSGSMLGMTSFVRGCAFAPGIPAEESAMPFVACSRLISAAARTQKSRPAIPSQSSRWLR